MCLLHFIGATPNKSATAKHYDPIILKSSTPKEILINQRQQLMFSIDWPCFEIRLDSNKSLLQTEEFSNKSFFIIFYNSAHLPRKNKQKQTKNDFCL